MGRKSGKLAQKYWNHIPPADDQPGLHLDWPEDCQRAMDSAISRVERWFAEKHKSNLWIALHIGCNEQENYTQRIAYESAFLWRLQQRLMANMGGVMEA